MEKSIKKEYLSNPFKVKDGCIIECYKIEAGGEYEFADVHSGEVNTFRKIGKSKRVLIDRSNYVKVYKGNNDLIRVLSSSGKELAFYVMLHIGIHSEIIFMDCIVVCEWCGWKKSTYYKALKEIIQVGILARKKGSKRAFFVNPNFVFNGSRLKIR